MLDVLERCFPQQWTGWQGKLREMVPSLGTKLSDDQALFDKVWHWSTKSLQLDVTSVAETTAPDRARIGLIRPTRPDTCHRPVRTARSGL